MLKMTALLDRGAAPSLGGPRCVLKGSNVMCWRGPIRVEGGLIVKWRGCILQSGGVSFCKVDGVYIAKWKGCQVGRGVFYITG